MKKTTMFSIEEDLLAGIGKGLLKREQTIAVAKSVTTGYIQPEIQLATPMKNHGIMEFHYFKMEKEVFLIA